MTTTIENKFAYRGGSVHVLKIDTAQVQNSLRPAVYTVMHNNLTGEFYLETTQSSFNVPAVVYGNSMERADRVLRTYNDRTKNTGVLLTGNKGSGKTMLSEIICNRMIAAGLPVIMVCNAFTGPAFNDFMTALGECVVLIDEFTKVYNTRDDIKTQEGLLTLMDGLGSTKKMFILTENYTTQINEFLLSRPGRLYYHFQYGKLDEDTIREYSNAKGIDEKIADEIIEVSRKCNEFSFDILTTIVEEYLRFGDSVEELVKDLNIQVRDASQQQLIEVTKLINKSNDTEMLVMQKDRIIAKPVHRHNCSEVEYYNPKNLAGPMPTEKEQEDECEEAYFYSSELKYESYDRVVYENESYIMIAKPVIQKMYNYDAF